MARPALRVLPLNGRVVEISAGGITLGQEVTTGRVHVFAGPAIPPGILREREILAEEGFASCSVLVDRVDASANLRVNVSIVTRGVIDEAEHAHELQDVRAAVRMAIAQLDTLRRRRMHRRCMHRLAVRRSFFKSRGKKPMTVVHVTRSS